MAELERLETFITENFRIKDGETAVDAAIRLLKRLRKMIPKPETEEIVSVEKGEHGRTRQVYLTKDKDTGELLKRKVELTSYYDTGEIDKIKQRWFDGKGNLLRERIIKHFKDGRQQPKIIEKKKAIDD